MTKQELIAKIATDADLSKAAAERALNALTDTVTEELAKGGKVQLVGFGNWSVVERAARKGRNPQTGAEIEIPAHKTPVFKPGKALKDAVVK